jgi:hypothetical protein
VATKSLLPRKVSGALPNYLRQRGTQSSSILAIEFRASSSQTTPGSSGHRQYRRSRPSLPESGGGRSLL